VHPLSAGPVRRPLPPLQATATAGPETGTANGAQTSYITVSGLPDYYEVLGVRSAARTLTMGSCGSGEFCPPWRITRKLSAAERSSACDRKAALLQFAGRR
jgi:hypothetical protein